MAEIVTGTLSHGELGQLGSWLENLAGSNSESADGILPWLPSFADLVEKQAVPPEAIVPVPPKLLTGLGVDVTYSLFDAVANEAIKTPRTAAFGILRPIFPSPALHPSVRNIPWAKSV